MIRRMSALLVVSALALAVAAPARADDDFTPAQRGALEKIIKSYLLEHPEVLQEAMSALEKKQAAAEAEKAKTAIKDHSDAIFNSPYQVTLGNPKGDIIFVEFFDYNCGYCKRAMTDMFTLLEKDPNLKVVLKEFPVLGPGSVEAARVAVAVRMQDKTGTKYREFHQKLLGGRGQADKARALAVAKEVGLDMARLDKDLKSEEVTTSINESMKLAEELGINGTPSYVIGRGANGDLVVGAVGLEALNKKIDASRTQ
jgi:protein-disulfide isomerase